MFKFLSRLFKPAKSNIDRGVDFGKSMIDKCGNDGIEYLERERLMKLEYLAHSMIST